MPGSEGQEQLGTEARARLTQFYLGVSINQINVYFMSVHILVILDPPKKKYLSICMYIYIILTYPQDIEYDVQC